MNNNEDRNKNMIEKIKKIMLSNPILYIFTKEYKTETEYIEFMKQHIDSFKLLPGSETEDEIMERLINMPKVESSINYNLLLTQRKNMLKKEIDRIDSELKLQQDVCDHIKVCIGWDGPFLYRDTSICKCLLCGENEPDSRYPLIEAHDYKKEIYSHGELFSYRENRFIELQNLAINILNRKPDLSMIQLVEIMNDIIKNPVASNYQELAIACHTNPEIQLNVNKPATQVEQKNIKKKVQTKDIMITLIKYNHSDRLTTSEYLDLLKIIYKKLNETQLLDKYKIAFNVDIESLKRVVKYNSDIFIDEIRYSDEIRIRVPEKLDDYFKKYFIDETIDGIIKDYCEIKNIDNIKPEHFISRPNISNISNISSANFRGAITSDEMSNIIEKQGPVLKKARNRHI